MKKSLVLTALITLASACGTEGPPVIEPNILSNALEGEFGDVAVDERDVLEAEIYHYSEGEYSSLSANLVAPLAEGGALMAGLSLDNLDPLTLPVGTHIEVRNAAYGDIGVEPMAEEEEDLRVYEGPTLTVTGPDGQVINAEDAYVYAFACAGEVAGNWLEDAPADDIDIIIEEGSDGVRGIDLSLTFTNGQELSGLVVLDNILDANWGEPEPLPVDVEVEAL